jgi:hypothetical protein
MQTKWQEKKMKEMTYKVRETFVKRGASLMSTLIKREKKGKKRGKKNGDIFPERIVRD